MFALLTIVCVGLTAYVDAHAEVNLARLAGVTCDVSSEYSTDYTCENAYDGVILPGAGNEFATKAQPENNWIQLNFPSTVYINRIVLFPRCHNGDQTANIEVETCSKKFHLTRECNGKAVLNCDGVVAEIIEINALAENVKISSNGQCASGYDGNIGYREVQVFGVEATEVNLARLAGVTCDASSEYSADFTCENAYDGVILAGEGNEFATKAQPENNWIQLNFPRTVFITRIALFPRCHNGDQTANIEVETCGKKFQLTRECNGKSVFNCDGVVAETIEINAFAENVKISSNGQCADGYNGNIGYREVQVFGIEAD